MITVEIRRGTTSLLLPSMSMESTTVQGSNARQTWAVHSFGWFVGVPRHLSLKVYFAPDAPQQPAATSWQHLPIPTSITGAAVTRQSQPVLLPFHKPKQLRVYRVTFRHPLGCVAHLWTSVNCTRRGPTDLVLVLCVCAFVCALPFKCIAKPSASPQPARTRVQKKSMKF